LIEDGKSVTVGDPNTSRLSNFPKSLSQTKSDSPNPTIFPFNLPTTNSLNPGSQIPVKPPRPDNCGGQAHLHARNTTKTNHQSRPYKIQKASHPHHQSPHYLTSGPAANSLQKTPSISPAANRNLHFLVSTAVALSIYIRSAHTSQLFSFKLFRQCKRRNADLLRIGHKPPTYF
jgi:hypothetical protein